MKKPILCLLSAMSLILLTKLTNAQSQRLVLSEEFTQASCGPCAAANPAFNALLGNNVGKVIAIKYQTSWPGTDPMNAQTETWVAPRVTLYSVSGVPDAFLDGINPPIIVSGSYAGYPGNINQSVINTEYAVASPFTMNISFSYTPNYDSVNVKCIYTCTQAVTMATPKLQIAMIEDHIHFASAPGTNGETDFYNVMRRMYPNANGTALKTTWAVGDKDSLSFKAIVPSYIYNKAAIAFVAFIQDIADFSVKQAAYSAPKPMALDAAVIILNNIPTMQCSATFTPTIYLKNTGTTTLTSATISYKIDNGTASTQPWTGSLAYGDSVLITLPLITGTNGTHTFTASVTSPNGGSDQNISNDAITKSFSMSLNTPVLMPLTEGFAATTFPPTNWIIINPDGGLTWKRATAGGFANGSGSAEIGFYDITETSIDDLLVAPIDLSSATAAAMTFSVAHAQYNSSYVDELQVMVSTDCGATWTSAWDKSDPSLATATATTSSFTPTTAAQWRSETVNLNSYIGQSKVFVKFHAISGYGNNCYIDDINIAQNSGVQNLNNNSYNIYIYPNPVTTTTSVEFSLAHQDNVSFGIYNLLGEKVYSIERNIYSEGAHIVTINVADISEGIYYLVTTIGDQKNSQKITVIK